MYFVCAGCGQCFYLTVPGGNLKGHIIHFSWNQENTKFAQFEFHAFEHGPLLEALFFTDGDGLILIVLHTMGRHNYLHITKLSQTAAARNQQVSVNDKRCLSKRKRISQLGAAAALQTSRSGWIWEPATTLWRSGFSSSSDHLGIIISRFQGLPASLLPN